MANVSAQEIKRFELAAFAIVSTLVEANDTVREGPLYAALMSEGFTLSDFQKVLVPIIVHSGLAVRTPSFGLVATDKGRAMVAAVKG